MKSRADILPKYLQNYRPFFDYFGSSKDLGKSMVRLFTTMLRGEKDLESLINLATQAMDSIRRNELRHKTYYYLFASYIRFFARYLIQLTALRDIDNGGNFRSILQKDFDAFADNVSLEKHLAVGRHLDIFSKMIRKKMDTKESSCVASYIDDARETLRVYMSCVFAWRNIDTDDEFALRLKNRMLMTVHHVLLLWRSKIAKYRSIFSRITIHERSPIVRSPADPEGVLWEYYSSPCETDPEPQLLPTF